MTQYIQNLKDHEKIREYRNSVLPIFNKSHWPATDEEEWRRTDISVFDLDDLGHPDAELRENTSAEIKSGGIHRLNDLLNEGGASLPDAVLERVFKALEHLRDDSPNKLSLWNLLLSEDIFVLHVPRGSESDELHELCWHSLGEDVSRHATVVVIAEQMSKARMALRFKGMGGHLQNVSAVYLVDDAADLGVSVLQESSDEVVAFYQAYGTVGRDARLFHFEGILGGGFVKNRVEFALDGSGSDLNLDGIYFADDEQHIDMRTVQHHKGEHASSRTYYKGAIRDEAETVFQGLIDVNHEARGTDAYLTNNNLVLNDGAHADSIPSLNIKTDDVKCSHGSTTGRIDEEQIYYLRCRGFSREEAREMLILGYFEDLITGLPEKMQDDVRQQIHRRLKGRL